MVEITTSSNSKTYYRELSFGFVPSNCVDCDIGVDEGVCVDPSHEDEHAPIYCMWHGQAYKEHEVGGMYLECHKQWFFSSDWSSPECRALLDRVPLWRRALHWIRNQAL